MFDDQVTQNVSEETTPADSSTVENDQQPDTTQQQVAKEGAVEGQTKPPSWENAYGELRRKIDETHNLLQQTVMAVGKGTNNPIQTQPQISAEEYKYKGYTRTQLENVLNHPEATEQDRLFANRGLGVIEAKEEAVREFESRNQKAQSQSRQQAALGQIVSDYPQVYSKESNSWNYSDPLFQRGMAIFNSDPRLTSFGNEGLQVAMDRAFAQMTREGSLALKKKEVTINAKERQTQKIQSQALQSGTQGAPKSDQSNGAKLKKLMDDYGKTQDPRLFTEIAKLKGLIPSNLR